MEAVIVTAWLLVSHNFGPKGPMYADLASCESVRECSHRCFFQIQVTSEGQVK